MSPDTREKIVTAARAAARAKGSPVLAFVTHFEVLHAGHVRKLEQAAATHSGKIAIVLTDPESPLVPLDARAELAAALRTVDYVIPAERGALPALAALNPAVIVHDEEEDRARTRQLIDHVRNRSRA